MRIDLGCGKIEDGENQVEGYLRQDIDPTIPGLDYCCDIKDLDKHVEKESCERIRASHVLEHFGTDELDSVLMMLYGLLEANGELEIIVPNFKWHCELVLQGDEERAVNYAFGGQKDPWDFHKTGLTPNILTKKLIKAGFKVKELLDESSITCIAIK